MTDRLTVSGLDKSSEGTRTALHMTTLTAANFDAQITAAQAIQGAIQGISLIDFEGLSIAHVDAPTETDLPASPYAQREAKWLVRYSDDVTAKSYTVEIGGPDLTLLASDGKTLDVSGGAGAAFVTAFEANVVSPVGNAVTYIEAVHVGRNN